VERRWHQEGSWVLHAQTGHFFLHMLLLGDVPLSGAQGDIRQGLPIQQQGLLAAQRAWVFPSTATRGAATRELTFCSIACSMCGALACYKDYHGTLGSSCFLVL